MEILKKRKGPPKTDKEIEIVADQLRREAMRRAPKKK